jgi:transcriptional regulator of arginine metabolism
MTKKDRQRRLTDLVRVKSISNQHDLLSELAALGLNTNQATVSRDLQELGISKVNGIYTLPRIHSGESSFTDFLEVDTAGDHILVLKTSPGRASIIAISIDALHIPEIVGTVAGDDTVFVATKDSSAQKAASRKILHHFKH